VALRELLRAPTHPGTAVEVTDTTPPLDLVRPQAQGGRALLEEPPVPVDGALCRLHRRGERKLDRIVEL
jgi:hypothetical protein